MKLLHCTHSLNLAGGGPADFLFQVAQMQERYSLKVDVLSLDRADDPYVKQFPAVVYAVGPGLFKYGYTQKFVNWLSVHRKEYDIVIVDGLWQYSSLGTWLALHGTDTPYVVFPHGMLDPWFNERYPFKHLKKLLYWPFGDYRVLRDAKAVLFTSHEEKRRASRSFKPYKAHEIVVGYGTLSPQGDQDRLRQSFFAKYPHLQGKTIILYLGRIQEKKGCDLLLKAFLQVVADYPNLHLVLAGPSSNNYAEKLRCSQESQLLNNLMTWTGMLLGDLKWGALLAAEVLILPSHQENFARAVVEALSCATPVLISDKVNIWREIAQDEAGLIEPDNVIGTTSLLKRWLGMDQELKQEMRQKARICFARRFDLHKIFPLYLSVLKECMQNSQNT